MDEEGIAAVAVRGVVPRPLENLTCITLLSGICDKKCGYVYSFSTRFKLCHVMLCIPDDKIYKNGKFHSGRIILLFVLNVLWVD